MSSRKARCPMCITIRDLSICSHPDAASIGQWRVYVSLSFSLVSGKRGSEDYATRLFRYTCLSVSMCTAARFHSDVRLLFVRLSIRILIRLGLRNLILPLSLSLSCSVQVQVAETARVGRFWRSTRTVKVSYTVSTLVLYLSNYPVGGLRSPDVTVTVTVT